jgi:hypothetical protein
MNLNLVTVCVDNYDLEYARKLITKVQQVSKFNIAPFCITDRPAAQAFCNTVRPALNVPGWWNKIQVYNLNVTPEWTLYMDLDIVVQSNFDEEIQHVIDTGRKDTITCVSDALGWMDNKFSSSWMMFYGSNQVHIYNRFVDALDRDPSLCNFRGGDQVWIGHNVKPSVDYIDDIFPYLKKNLKFDLAVQHDGIPNDGITSSFDSVTYKKWKWYNDKIDPRIKLVDCGGRPKPHELQQLNFIKSNWFDV